MQILDVIDKLNNTQLVIYVCMYVLRRPVQTSVKRTLMLCSMLILEFLLGMQLE